MARNRLNAVGNSYKSIIIAHLISAVFSFIYGYLKSKQIYDRMSSLNLIAGNHSSLFLYSVLVIAIGEFIIFAIFLLPIDSIFWPSVIISSIGYCMWTYALYRTISNPAVRPKSIVRMLWANIIAFQLQVALIVTFFVSSKYMDIPHEIISIMIVLICGHQLCFASMSGSMPWDICFVTPELWQQEHEYEHNVYVPVQP